MPEKDLVFAIFGEYKLFDNDILNRAVDTLTEREKFVLIFRFGLRGFPELTLKGISIKLSNIKTGENHISVERVRQIEAIALRKMRHPSRYKTFILD